MSPHDLVRAVERSGLLTPLQEWLLATACEQSQSWQDAGLQPVRLSIPLPGYSFGPGLPQRVESALDRSGLSPAHLELTLSETTLGREQKTALAVLGDLDALGLDLAVGDFGSGHSGMTILRRLPFGRLKLAPALVSGLPDEHDDVAFAEAIVAVAKSLKLGVVACGVESLPQVELLRALGCDELQGSFLSEPLSAEEFALLMDREKEDDAPG